MGEYPVAKEKLIFIPEGERGGWDDFNVPEDDDDDDRVRVRMCSNE